LHLLAGRAGVREKLVVRSPAPTVNTRSPARRITSVAPIPAGAFGSLLRPPRSARLCGRRGGSGTRWGGGWAGRLGPDAAKATRATAVLPMRRCGHAWVRCAEAGGRSSAVCIRLHRGWRSVRCRPRAMRQRSRSDFANCSRCGGIAIKYCDARHKSGESLGRCHKAGGRDIAACTRCSASRSVPWICPRCATPRSVRRTLGDATPPALLAVAPAGDAEPAAGRHGRAETVPLDRSDQRKPSNHSSHECYSDNKLAMFRAVIALLNGFPDHHRHGGALATSSGC